MTIVPRWEWRAFGESLGAAGSRFESLSPERVEESDDRYVLSPDSDASVKVRDGLMDVKRLERVDDEGLEQWNPVLKASFPALGSRRRLRAGVAAHVRPAARSRRLRARRARRAVGAGEPRVLVVDVHKRRERYTLGGCMAERSEMRTTAGATRTIAIESEDPARWPPSCASSASCRVTTCASRAAEGADRVRRPALRGDRRRHELGQVPCRRASRDGEWRTIVDRAEVTRLGEGLQETGRLGAAPMQRSVTAIAAMADEARRDGVEAIAAVGTAGLRLAPNSADFVDAVRARCGLEIEIIAAEEERRLAFLAATAGLGPSRARSSFSTRAAAARNSPSARGSGSAWTSAPSATRSGTASTASRPRRRLPRR
jgi:exopolyphosphatase/guanosine-5'-triphosphate,3'-diphosphate pyrophosphatase